MLFSPLLHNDVHCLCKGKASEPFIELKVKVNQKDQLTSTHHTRQSVVLAYIFSQLKRHWSCSYRGKSLGNKLDLFHADLSSVRLLHTYPEHTEDTLLHTEECERKEMNDNFSLYQIWWLSHFCGCHWNCVSDPFTNSPGGELSDNVEAKVKMINIQTLGETKATLCGAEGFSTWLVPKTISH